MAKLGLNLSDAKVFTGFTVLPAGMYNFKIASCELKENNAKTGHYLEVGFQVLDGEHEGSQVTDRYNIDNPNKEAQEIGKNQLKTMITMAGHSNPDMIADTDELIGLKVKAAIEEEKTTYKKDGEDKEGKQNRFKSFFKYDANISSQPVKKETAAPTQESAPATTTPTESFPWEN